ncbi:MAG: sterol desaturase family protein [Balneola sp.]|nr:sterol desaturase family protein [Balneola sp.]MBO6651692.1 sterol desaturase family protein [Balneola sp.]MBO6712870.1 sterol desaturase family protein [Balneola sp.]MBO6801169.1 sterol desaturase family protein [Balneola sp.]MBO6871361.1 sterol desaturase family protein [Balneola sp.]
MSQKFVSNKDKSEKMFENRFLNALTKAHFTFPLILYIPAIIYLSFLFFREGHGTGWFFIGLFIAGFILWSMFEYLVHRFVFHYEPKTEFGEKVLFTFHGVHHDYPNDSFRLVMPPVVSIPLYAVMYLLFEIIFGYGNHFSIFSGFVLGYLFYDVGHYALHHFNFKNKYFQSIKKHHLLHHYKDEHHGFGVSMPFWDKIFNTGFDKDEK